MKNEEGSIAAAAGNRGLIVLVMRERERERERERDGWR